VAQALLPVLRRRSNSQFKQNYRRIKFSNAHAQPAKSNKHV